MVIEFKFKELFMKMYYESVYKDYLLNFYYEMSEFFHDIW